MTLPPAPSRKPAICVYCGSSVGNDPAYLEAARQLGELMAKAGFDLVYGGGNIGLMGAVSEAAGKNGAFVTGIIPGFLIERENLESGIVENGELIRVETMHQRKHMMFEKADAFVTLPGGIGTLEEIIEVLTWAQLGRHKKPIVLANINGFWEPLLNLLNEMRDNGFLHSQELLAPLVIDEPQQIIDAIIERLENANSAGDEAIMARL